MWIGLVGWLALAVASPEGAADLATVLPDSAVEVQIASEASEAVQAAYALLEAGRFPEAARAFGALADASQGQQARYFEALAWYEAGEIKSSLRAVKAVVKADLDHGPAWSLLGLVHADRGEGDEAEKALERAHDRAEATGDLALGARASLNQALVAQDRGQPDHARRALQRAERLATSAEDELLLAVVRANLANVEAVGGGDMPGDVLGQVAELLRRGDLRSARAAIPSGEPPNRREGVRRLLAAAAVDRAEGRLEGASLKARKALTEARRGGLVRETGAALAEIGTLFNLAGRFVPAFDALHEAVGVVAGTSFRVSELSYRVEAGKVAVRLGDLTQARDQLAAARRVAEGLPPTVVGPRLDELWAAVEATEGEHSAASRRLASVVDRYEATGAFADAARASTSLVTLHAAHRSEEIGPWEDRAVKLFERAGVDAGAAHVKVARGLGLARAEQYEQAIQAFVQAAELAEGLDTSRGQQIAAHARANAAAVLQAQGIDPALSARLAEGGELQTAMTAHKVYAEGEERYRAGLQAFERGAYAEARESFTAALESFSKLDDPALTATARRSRGWAARNEAIRAQDTDALPLFQLAERDAEAAQDPELLVRAKVGAALASSALDRSSAQRRLLEAADLAEEAGRIDDAVRCLTGLADALESLDDRISVARRAALLDPSSPLVTHALYSAAVDAYNYEDYALALSLAEELAPRAGSLADPVEAVRAAAAAAMAE